jgi:succinate dehydrogenase/fumarate reductase flavoprotein subunit
MHEYDVVVVGSGVAGLTAALTAAEGGLRVFVAEKTALFGGTTCHSEGMVWIPLSRQAQLAGVGDSSVAVVTYLRSVIGNYYDEERVNAYLENAAQALAFVEDHSGVCYSLATGSGDYYPNAEGATVGTRALNAGIFDARKIGDDFVQLRWPLRTTMAFGGMTIAGFELERFYAVLRSPSSAFYAAKIVTRYIIDRLAGQRRGRRIANGQGLIAALLERLRTLDVTLEAGMRVTGTEVAEGGSRTVTVETADGEITVSARIGLVIATGGFTASVAMRERFYTPIERKATHVSLASEGSAGDGVLLGERAGGALMRHMHAPAAWTPASLVPMPDGTACPWPHYLDRGKPGIIAVDRAGRRFVNEAIPYVDFVPAMLQTCKSEDQCEIFLLASRRALRRYGLGAVPPAPLPISSYLDSGYLIEAKNVAALAAQIGVHPEILRATIERFNRDARAGSDSQFGRGENAYDRAAGDKNNRPNPSLGPLEGHLYAVRVYPGSIATYVGLRTDARARVLDQDGSVIPGLYAAGNDAASVFGGFYPGAGISVGQGMTFGYLAGSDLVRAYLDGR